MVEAHTTEYEVLRQVLSITLFRGVFEYHLFCLVYTSLIVAVAVAMNA